MIIKRIFILLMILFQPLAYASTVKEKSYSEQDAWKQLQEQLPKTYQISADQLPQESYWNWKNYQIHLDAYPRPNSTAKVILLHGVGTNGRQLNLILGHPLAEAGYETIALDLPGYGLTKYPKKSDIRYDDWVQLVNDFVNQEAAKDQRPIFLYGLSAGGMLTLHVAMQNPHVKGIIGMTFLDQRNLDVKKGTMQFSFLSPILLPGMNITAKTALGNIPIPMSLVSKMNKLTNDPKALKIMLKDKTSAGNAMPIKFLESYMNYEPTMQIADFKQAPILLTQPEKDQWTPLELSLPVLDQLTIPYQVVLLPEGGHYPVEEKALQQLKKSSIEFIQKNTHQ